VLSPASGLSVGVSGLFLGLAIGCTGVGGVLLVPFLIYGVGLGVQVAIAVALFSYFFSGLVAVFLYARRGSIPWAMAGWLSLAALPGAYLGARVVPLVSGTVLQTLIAALLMAAGVNGLLARATEPRPARRLGAGVLLALGAMTGFLSALLGAGGAFILVPVLMALGQPVLLSVGLGQVVQVPISCVASVANLRAGLVDVPLATLMAVALTLGIAVGTPLAHALAQLTLRRVVALTMVAGGVAMGLRLLLG
jgi:uncharacterized protein